MRISNLCKLTLAIALAVPSAAFGDYTYQETTQITGGSIVSMMKLAGTFSSQARKAGDPVVTSIYLKGNRMAHVSADSMEIIDLDKQTVTHVDMVKKTYTVITFQQMKDQVAKARQQMQQQMQQPPAAQPASAPPPPSNVQMSFDVKVRETGATKQVSGLDTKEAILTMTMNATDKTTQQTGAMAVTNDMWLVPEIPGYRQIAEFYQRMGREMGSMTAGVGLDLSKLLAQNPGATQALSDMGKEMQKIRGVPVMQVMRMGTTINGQPLPAASEAPLPPDNTPAMPSGSDIAKQAAASAITSHLGALGGFGGFGHKKAAAPPPEPAANAPGSATPTSAVLMESQTTVSSFSSASVDPSRLEVPAGFKQIPAEGMQ
ncbi:MAG TPA: hypothetical protein VGU23_01270 [Acidobacteriaceae bacterium]|nr:hypothetical protein [Acidobacteriaceae bacterium]